MKPRVELNRSLLVALYWVLLWVGVSAESRGCDLKEEVSPVCAVACGDLVVDG